MPRYSSVSRDRRAAGSSVSDLLNAVTRAGGCSARSAWAG